MKPRLLNTVLATAVLLLGGGPSSPQSQSAPARMKAIVYHTYGSSDVLRLEEIDKPVPKENELLVKVRAASVNPLDWHFMEGSPYIIRLLASGLFKPKVAQLGVDFAGTVEAVGSKVTQFKAGDDVFGAKTGAFAEYISVSVERVALKPANLTFEQAASVPVAAITALQGLRDGGKVQPGQKVLINGASGGVGTFAVQIAKAFGADVTGVCSTRNVDMVRKLGASQVIDYTKEDFTKSGQRYDVVIDNVANHSLLENRRMLNPGGRYVLIGGGGVNENHWVGTLARPLKALVLSRFVNQDMGILLADITPQDLNALRDLMQSGKVTPVIDRTYTFNQIPEALRYLEEGHAKGKVVINLEQINEGPPASASLTAGPAGTSKSTLIALTFIAILIGVSIVPIVAAFILNRRFRRGHPERRSFRWGYYFSLMTVVGGLLLGLMLESGTIAMIICGVIYAVLAWFFARRHGWAWIVLTILSFNPVAWIINAIYLRKRWAETADRMAAPTQMAKITP
jgi:NADPH:quinone reductase-like Zn-dependent oxidoreductase